MMKEDVLRNTLFPLEQLNKDEVKRIAKDLKLNLNDKKESMGICFIGKRKFSSFIDKYIEPKKGNIIEYNTNKNIGCMDCLHSFSRTSVAKPSPSKTEPVQVGNTLDTACSLETHWILHARYAHSRP